ncbi:hypothetical protein [Kiloniella sp.]|uniref:hypothetical protein n=1 Tax=Kiloniella sp. TaxID=1938587 RepID=UPI003B01646E
MFFQFGKIFIILGGCLLLLPINHVVAQQNGYLTPKSSSNTNTLKPGVQSNKRAKKEHYLGSRIIYKTTSPVKELFTKEAKLSVACQRGRFIQVKEMQYIAIVGGRKYGAALYKNNMIHDPKGLGNKDKIYLFKGQGTSNCKVFQNKFNLSTIFKDLSL